VYKYRVTFDIMKKLVSGIHDNNKLFFIYGIIIFNRDEIVINIIDII
jgi:hypothetical protein